LPPYHFTETAAVLKKSEVSLQLAGGAGNGQSDATTAGGAIRVRAGLGNDQEAGGEVSVVTHAERPSDFQTFAAKGSWKLALTKELAFITGPGLVVVNDTQNGITSSVGGDGALVLSSDPSRWVGVYTALRIGFTVGITHVPGGALGELIFGSGLFFRLGHLPIQLFLEGGFVGVLLVARPSTSGSADGYGALGITYTFGRHD
jgi:hypothetical protein